MKTVNEAVVWWKNHIESIKPSLSNFALHLAASSTSNPECFGLEQGQIRLGELGQFDLYYTLLDCNCSKAECLLASGLTAKQIQKAEDDENLLDNGVDPTNPIEVADFQRFQNMTAAELDAELLRLEKKLQDAGN